MDDLKLHERLYRLGPVDVDLTITALTAAIGRYRDRFGETPSCIVCSSRALEEAYQVVTAMETRLPIVPVPGMHWDVWMVVGESGILYSPGA